MDEPVWVKVLSIFAPAVFTLVAFLFGKATKGATNQMVLDAMCKRMDALEEWQLKSAMPTLASHVTLHEGYTRTLEGIQRELRELNTNVSRLSGVLQGPTK